MEYPFHTFINFGIFDMEEIITKISIFTDFLPFLRWNESEG
jgi:hypothetical protein